MIPQNHQVSAGIVITGLLELAVVIRIMLRPQRDPAARIAWVLVVAMFPLMGMLADLLVGEVRLGRAERLGSVLSSHICPTSLIAVPRRRPVSRRSCPSIADIYFNSATR